MYQKTEICIFRRVENKIQNKKIEVKNIMCFHINPSPTNQQFPGPKTSEKNRLPLGKYYLSTAARACREIGAWAARDQLAIIAARPERGPSPKN